MIELLRESSLFRGCTPAELADVAARCTRREYPAGTPIFEAHAPAEHVYVVEHGAVELGFPLQCYGATQQITVDRKLRGDVLGWSALVAAHGFSLSATAMWDTTLLQIRSADLDQLFADDHFGHVVMRRLAEIIAQRFTVMQQMFIDMLQDGVVP
jgi:CRP-like cAMP-binding protein